MQFVRYNVASGRISGGGDVPGGSEVLSLPPDFYGPDESLLPLDVNLPTLIEISNTMYVQDGEFVDRPKFYAGETALAIDQGEDFVVPDVPEGTEVHLNGKPVGSVNDGQLVFSSVDSRVHHMRLLPPFPWLELYLEVTVR